MAGYCLTCGRHDYMVSRRRPMCGRCYAEEVRGYRREDASYEMTYENQNPAPRTDVYPRRRQRGMFGDDYR